jgi:hypothetical protein
MDPDYCSSTHPLCLSFARRERAHLVSQRKLAVSMSHPHYHSKSSARRFGGVASDYHELHEWFDQVKAHLPDVRHRAVLHSSFGIFLAQ